MNKNYRNEYLFSEIYLQEITERPVTDENLKASLQTIREWREYADKTSLEKWITTYIEPVLDTLGFGHHRAEEKISNVLLLFPDVDRIKPMSICYVVPPGEDINCTIKRKHWAEKIIRNLRKYNFEWGVLIDGIYWRIYHTKESTPYENYVEVNLESILNNKDYPAFQIFYFFFQPDNFIKKQNGECKFDNYKEESVKTTEYIEDNLSDAIEREEEGGGVLQTLCLGYLDALRKETYSEKERQRIYGGAILYLFRLLFLFYSTARDLLKSESIESFKSIVLDSFRFHNKGGAQSSSYDLWLRLQDLFAEIDLTYDGGLFNPYEESAFIKFIEQNKITDPFISEVVFGLAYYQKPKRNFVAIEYRDLSVRHLGSLYEGLLEHNLFIAPENTVVRKSGAKVRFIPQSQAGRITRSETIIEKGKVYFSEDAKERKLTGSYYTPEDVVEYIVKNTVDALLEGKKKELLADIEPILKELDSAINESERKRLELFTDDKVVKFIEKKILSLSVLDPTMGSGHFLVNATNYIVNFIVELLNEFPEYNPKISSDPVYWRRRVVEDCIYGVDLNPLAVDLAKLCLWITTAFKEKPLSFLNHHLKQGNALVGVRISDLEEHLKRKKSDGYDLFMQSYINSVRQASKGYKEKLSKLTEEREDIEEKKETLAELDKNLFPYEHLCNFFTHYLIGELKETDLLLQIENWKKPNRTEKITASLSSKDFFHWDLEFPDVFYGDNLGFDCVIGNPPYVEYSEVQNTYKIIPYEEEIRIGRNKIRSINPSGYKTFKCGNIYAFLIERSTNFLNNKGKFGMIIPISAFCTDRMDTLQDILIKNCTDLWISNFAERPSKIFRGVERNVSIFIATKGHEVCKIYTSTYIKWYSEERKKLFDNIHFVESSRFKKKGIIPKIGYEIELDILYKVDAQDSISKIADYVSNSKANFVLYYRNSGGRYWKIITCFQPKFYKNGIKSISSRETYLYASDEKTLKIIVASLNSSLYYWYYVLHSDSRTNNPSDLKNFPLDLGKMEEGIKQELVTLCDRLMSDYKNNSEMRNAIYRTGNIKFQQFYPSKSKDIIDDIDRVLGKHYGLSEKEIDFILSYDLNYRMKGEDS